MSLIRLLGACAASIATAVGRPVTLNWDAGCNGGFYLRVEEIRSREEATSICAQLQLDGNLVGTVSPQGDLCVHLPEIKATPLPHDAGLRLDDAERTLRALGYVWVLGEWVAPTPPEAAHKLNSTGSVAVATDVFWNRDMASCPRGVKVQLLGAGGVAAYGVYNGDKFWTDWAPVPRRRPA